MVEESEAAPLEKERMKIERLRVYEKIITVFITVAIGTLGVAIINHSFQNRQLEQQKVVSQAELDLQKEKAEADRRQAEMQYLGAYLEHALQDDVSRRLRFAEYFSILTMSPDLQERWKAYYTDMEAAVAEKQQLETALVNAQENGDNETQQEVKNQIFLLDLKLAQLDEPSPYFRVQDDYAIGFTQRQSPPKDQDPDQQKLRERGQLFLEMEFLNTLSQHLRDDLSEQERANLRERIMNIKLLLLKGVWDPAWGKFETFREWVDSGAADPVPEGFIKPADYYRYQQEEG